MKITRITAATLLAQGALPALAFGIYQPEGLFLLEVLLVYSTLSWGVLWGWKWAIYGAIAATVPQVLVINGEGYCWQLSVGGSLGYGFGSLRACVEGLTFSVGAFLDPAFLNAKIIGHYNFGANFAAGFAENSHPHAFPFGSGGAAPFMAVNLIAVGVLILLLVSHRALQESAEKRGDFTPPPLPIATQHHGQMHTA